VESLCQKKLFTIKKRKTMKNEKNIQQIGNNKNQIDEIKNYPNSKDFNNISTSEKKLCTCGSGKDYKDCHGKQV
jgi:hypothetical protein